MQANVSRGFRREAIRAGRSSTQSQRSHAPGFERAAPQKGQVPTGTLVLEEVVVTGSGSRVTGMGFSFDEILIQNSIIEKEY
jgi:hypothetical protein